MSEPRAPLITPVLVGGCFIILISIAIRASFGVFPGGPRGFRHRGAAPVREQPLSRRGAVAAA